MADSEEQNQFDLEAARLSYQRAQEELGTEEPQPVQQQMSWGVFLVGLILSLTADICEISLVAAPLVIVIDVILGFMLGFSAGARRQWKKWIAGFLPIPLLRVALLIWAFVSSRSGIVQKVKSKLGTAQTILNVASKIPSPIAGELKIASKVVNVAADVSKKLS